MEKKEKAPVLRFKDTNGKDYPAWEQRKLGELAATFGYGLNAAAKSFDGKHKYIRITDIDESTRKFLSNSLTSPDIDFEEATPYRLVEGDVLFARTGASVGKSYRYVKTDGEVYFAGFLIRFRFKDKETAEFVFQNSLTAQFQNFIKTSSQRSGQPGVNAQQFSGYQIAVPNSEEQEKIGSFFSQLETAITLHQRKLEALKKLKRTLLQKMFPKKGQLKPELRFPGFTNDWEQRKLGDIGTVQMNKRIFKTQTSTSGEIPFYKIGTFGKAPDAYISRELFEEYKRKYPYPKKGDLLLSASGSIGNVVEYDGEEAYFQDSNIVWLEHGATISNRFLKAFYSVVNWEGIEGTTIKRLYNKTILDTPITLPSFEEQERIGNLFTVVDKVITLHQRKLETYKKLKKGLLQKMFI